MKKSLIIYILLLGNISWADLSGVWLGTGSWTYDEYLAPEKCLTMTMQWSETKNSIAIVKGVSSCIFEDQELDKTVWTIKDGLLFDEKQKGAGSYDGTNLEVYMTGPNKKVTIYLKLRLDGNHYEYTEIWFNSDRKIYVIEGLFTLHESNPDFDKSGCDIGKSLNQL